MTTRASNLSGANSCSVQGLASWLHDMIALDMPCMIQGGSGIGKSDIVRDVVDTAGYVLYDRRASQMLPEDLSGIPLGDAIAKTTERCIPDLVAEAHNLYTTTGKSVALFLDEINLGQMGVLSGLYEVVLDRRAGNYEFPPGTRVITAGNRAEDGASVIEMPRPLLNRMAICTFEGPTIDEWSSWAIDHDIHPMILTALNVQPEFLHGRFDAEAERNPTCRSWAAASKALQRLDATARGGDRASRVFYLSSYVGDEAALKVENIYDMASRLHDPKRIMTAPKSVGGHSDLALSFLQTLQLSNMVASVADTTNAFAWVEAHHPELMAVLVQSVARRHHALPDVAKAKGGLIGSAALLSKVSSYNRDYMSAGHGITP